MVKKQKRKRSNIFKNNFIYKILTKKGRREIKSRIKQRKVNFLNRDIKIIKSYILKTIFVSLYSFMILLILHLANYKITFINFFSSIALYFMLNELGEYLYILKHRGKK